MTVCTTSKGCLHKKHEVADASLALGINPVKKYSIQTILLLLRFKENSATLICNNDVMEAYEKWRIHIYPWSNTAPAPLSDIDVGEEYEENTFDAVEAKYIAGFIQSTDT